MPRGHGGGHGGPHGGPHGGMHGGMGHRPPRRGCMGCGCLPMVMTAIAMVSVLVYFII